jgi:hypothetical protein
MAIPFDVKKSKADCPVFQGKDFRQARFSLRPAGHKSKGGTLAPPMVPPYPLRVRAEIILPHFPI